MIAAWAPRSLRELVIGDAGVAACYFVEYVIKGILRVFGIAVLAGKEVLLRVAQYRFVDKDDGVDLFIIHCEQQCTPCSFSEVARL